MGPLKISEIIKILERRKNKYNDIIVQITWEGTRHMVYPNQIYASKDGHLLIDADDNCYKEEDAIDQNEGDEETLESPVSAESGPLPPSFLFPGQIWNDTNTDPPTSRIRNISNTRWLTSEEFLKETLEICRRMQEMPGSIFGPKLGMWTVHSDKDPRWNRSGCGYDLVTGGGPQEMKDWIEECKRNFGDSPDDCTMEFWKD